MNGKTWLRRLGIVLLSLLLAAGAAQAAEGGTVRVLLSQLNAQTSLRFRTSCRYALDGVEIPADTNVEVRLTDGRLRISFDESDVLDCGAEAVFLRGAGETGGVRFETSEISNLYCGDLHLTAQENRIVPVLSTDVEDYLCGVLADANTEPMEAIKAEAIAARSFASRRAETEVAQPYDLTDDADEYVFAGFSEAWQRTKQAVDATRGTMLYDGGAPALCRITDSNGGQTESARNAWNLDGGVVMDDPYDLESRTAAVKTARISRDGAQLDARLREYLIDGMAQQLTEWGMSPKAEDISIQRVKAVEAVNPAYSEPSRVYRSLRIALEVRSANPSTGKPVDCGVSVEVPTFGGIEEWYDLSINPEENETVSVTETEDAFEISFRRSGSGVGLSRCGASTMATKYDMDCAAILDFYFPGTELRTTEMTVFDPAREDDMKTPSPYALPTIAPVETEIAPTTAPAPAQTPKPVATASAAPTYPAEAILPMLTPEPDADSADALPAEEDYEIAQDEMLANPDASPGDSDTISLDEMSENEIDLDAILKDSDEILLEGSDEAFSEDFDEEFSNDEFDDDDFDDEFSDDEMALDELDDMVSLDGFDDEIPLDADDVFEEKASDALPEMTAPAEETRRFVNVKESGSLTLRSQPSERGEKLGKLRRGESVCVIELGGGWAQVVTEDGREGYVSTAYLTETAPQDEPVADAWERFRAEHANAKKCNKTAKARVNVWMRADASTESEALCKVAGGKKVEVLGYDDTWAYVRYRDKNGFIVKKYLKFGA